MLDSRPSVGIVTVTYNSAEVLDEFLSSLAAQSPGSPRFRLYAVDNASVDASVQKLRSASGLDVWVLAGSSNLGSAAGNNLGIERAIEDGCDWVLLLNNDTVLPPDFLSRIVSSATELGAELLSPRIDATDPPGTVWYAGGHIERWKALKPVHHHAGSSLDSTSSIPTVTEYAPACCLLVAPRVFRKVGLLDPTYFVYFEDQDFAMRASQAGFVYWYDPRITMLHKYSSLTGGPKSLFTLRWISRNRIVICRRHLKRWERLIGFVYLQAWTWAYLAVRRDSVREFLLRQRSYIEGARLKLQEVPQLTPIRNSLVDSP
jgi:GT2 family glycosyltransferase